GPFIDAVPKEMEAAAQLPALGYTSAAEALAEKFHVSIGLLTALNPGAAFNAGSVIVTVSPHIPLTGVEVASVEVDRAARAVRAFGADGKLLASYPASVGSTEMPAPAGTWKVRAVAPRPVYYYDPSRLNFGRTAAKGKLKVAAGPNNPVGSTWIDLTKDTYGIHGTPDPETTGKHQSHGCVRLTNWDAAELGKIIKKGATVAFVGSNTAKRAKAA
ncbi:MAG: L,D-transpeptidase, partial [Caulobacteraceae bacterium]